MNKQTAYVTAHAKIAALFKDKAKALQSTDPSAKAYLQLEVEYRKEFGELFDKATVGVTAPQAIAWQVENCLIRARANLEAKINYEDLEDTIEVFAFGFTGKIRKYK